MFILENVKGIIKRDEGKILKKIRIKTAEGQKAYNISYEIMDTQDHGISKSRTRWYCVGIRKDTAITDYVLFLEPCFGYQSHSFWIKPIKR